MIANDALSFRRFGAYLLLLAFAQYVVYAALSIDHHNLWLSYFDPRFGISAIEEAFNLE